MALFSTIFGTHNLGYDNYSMIGAIYEKIVLALSGLLQIIINLFLFTQKRNHLSIVKSVIGIECKYIRKDEDIICDKCLKLFKVNIIVCIVCFINCLLILTIVGSSASWQQLDTICFYMLYNFQTIFMGSFATMQTILAFICKEIILAMNKKIDGEVLKSVCEIKEILKDRNEILRICEFEISSLYGIPLLYIILCTLSTAPAGPFYLIVEFDENVNDFLSAIWTILNTCIIWITPSMVFPTMIFYYDPSEEVRIHVFVGCFVK